MHIEIATNARRDFLDVIHFQRERHPALTTQRIDEQRRSRAFRPLKQQRRPSHLAHAIGYFGNLKLGVHFRADALQLPFLLQTLDELPQIPISHNPSRRTGSEPVRHFRRPLLPNRLQNDDQERRDWAKKQ